MDNNINANGYDYVDLGLPSGTLWATMNVGALKPSDAGLYFQWGDTKGYTKDKVGRNKSFCKRFLWEDYKFSVNGSPSNFSKYTTKGESLELEDDAAHVNMGGSWHIPSPKQFQELKNNTISDWIALNGISGMEYTSKKDSSKSIFIPAAGYAGNGELINSESEAYVWTSMLGTEGAYYGVYLDFYSKDSNHTYLNCAGRNCGLSVRGVIG